MRDIATKVTGSSLTADEFNDIPTELENAITAAGIALSAGDLTQLRKAIAHYVGNASFYTDTGVADAYVATPIGTNPAPPAYVDGMAVEFIIGNTNTGASTINVNGLGVVNITATAAAGTLTAGNFIKLRHNIGSGEFDIIVNGVFDSSKFLRNDQSGVLTGNLDVTGNFSSLGIDDNATGERMQIEDGSLVLGTSTINYTIRKAGDEDELFLSGGDSSFSGANIILRGGSHATLANDVSFRADSTNTLVYDDSASEWDFQANDMLTTGKVTGVNSNTAWVNFDGTGVVAIRDDFNVSSITDNGTGDYTVNFTAALANANYSAVGSAGLSTAAAIIQTSGFATGSVDIDSFQINTASTRIDKDSISVQVFGG
jgi:hypothetical protein